MSAIFTTAHSLHEGTWSTDGNFPPSPSSSPPLAIYWANQSKADNSKLFCDWLTILTSGRCQVAVLCSTNSRTCVHSVWSFVHVGPNPFCQHNNSSSICKIHLDKIGARLRVIRCSGQNDAGFSGFKSSRKECQNYDMFYTPPLADTGPWFLHSVHIWLFYQIMLVSNA